MIIYTEHINDVISKASRKVNVLSRISPYMNMDKKQILMNSFSSTISSYCPLFFFFFFFSHFATNNKKDRLHERCLKMI